MIISLLCFTKLKFNKDKISSQYIDAKNTKTLRGDLKFNIY